MLPTTHTMPAPAASWLPAPVAPGPLPSAPVLPTHEDAEPSGLAPTGMRVLRCATRSLLALHHLLDEPYFTQDVLTEVVEADPVLALRVLHHANAGHPASDSLRRAVARVGYRLSGLLDELATTAGPGPLPGTARIVTRARAVERLCSDEIGFTVGLLSGLADALGVPPQALVDAAGVSAVVGDAIIFGTGPYGPPVTAVAAFQAQDRARLTATRVSPDRLYDAYRRAARDAETTTRALG